MLQINENDKSRLIQFIDENDLDYTPIDNGISKFSIVAHDGIVFYLYDHNESYILAMYDKNKDRPGDPGSMPYEYFQFQSLTQILEQLSHYDKSIHKIYWYPTNNSIEVPFDANSYNEEWVSEFISDDHWRVESSDLYKYLVYENSDYKPELISPFNTLHEVSMINSKEYAKVDKLYFEIHPISCSRKNESYFLKLSCNNEEVLKEYINYNIIKKRGLKLFLDDMFTNMSRFRS